MLVPVLDVRWTAALMSREGCTEGLCLLLYAALDLATVLKRAGRPLVSFGHMKRGECSLVQEWVGDVDATDSDGKCATATERRWRTQRRLDYDCTAVGRPPGRDGKVVRWRDERVDWPDLACLAWPGPTRVLSAEC